MKRILFVMVFFFVMCTSMGATVYDLSNVSTDTICAVGSITEQSVELFASDDGAEYFVVVLNEIGEQRLQPNECHYAKANFDNLEVGKDYTAYVIAYKDGQKKYSQVHKFTTLDPNRILGDVNNPLVITEYKATPSEIVLTLAPSNVVGDIRWYLNDVFKGESFSVIGGFKNLEEDTSYKVTLKYNIGNIEHVTECTLKTTQQK